MIYYWDVTDQMWEDLSGLYDEVGECLQVILEERARHEMRRHKVPMSLTQLHDALSRWAKKLLELAPCITTAHFEKSP